VRLISLTKLLLLLCRAHYSPSPSNAERRTSSRLRCAHPTSRSYIHYRSVRRHPAALLYAGNIAATCYRSAVAVAIFSRRRRTTEALVTTTAAEVVVVILQLGLSAGGRARHLALDHTARCHTSPTAVSRLLAYHVLLTPACSTVQLHTNCITGNDDNDDGSADESRRQALRLGVENGRGHFSDRLASCLSTMPPPTTPRTLSSTLLLGVLTAAFLLPSALPLDDEPEVDSFPVEYRIF